MDGDALFAIATGASGRSLDMMTLAVMAAEAVAQAVVRGVRAASPVSVGSFTLPSAAHPFG
jgi:L-aminopeptidase/D-esterase-like protein